MFGVFGAAFLRGFTGFGFGLAAVPLLSLALPPTAVVPVVVTLQVAVGLIGLRHAIGECDWQSVRRLFPGLPLGVPVGLAILTFLPANPVRLVIGGLIATAVWLIHRGVRLPPNPSRMVSLGVGLVSGIISGLASMGGPPIIVYLLAVGHSAGRVRATAVVYFMLAGMVSMLPMAARGMINQQTLVWSAASIPALFGGTRLGSWAFFRSKPAHHRLVALVVLSALSVLLIGRALLGMRG
ncbi:MAG TPA: sulfite exporter TauE/SafE family protein [Rhodopila sp.]|nr:sulfite exporter TauE/SafE family protein [Rhodopila sp.]